MQDVLSVAKQVRQGDSWLTNFRARETVCEISWEWRGITEKEEDKRKSKHAKTKRQVCDATFFKVN